MVPGTRGEMCQGLGAGVSANPALLVEALNALNPAILANALNAHPEISKRLSEEKLRKLRSGLAQRRNLNSLGEAVYWAEALEAEDRLPDELSDLLRGALAPAALVERLARGR